ncbi:MAG TPA: hypothetical protein VLU46_12230 [Thermoanaerobaculia bacterium]|nr:hypothetical protein [Thermoanaerobaculia bacterium]
MRGVSLVVPLIPLSFAVPPEPAVVLVAPVLVCGRRRLRRPVVPVVDPVVLPVVDDVVVCVWSIGVVVVCVWSTGVVVLELDVIEPIDAVLSTAPAALVPLVPLTVVVLFPEAVVKLEVPEP